MNLSNKKRGQTRLHHRRRLQLWWIFDCTAAPCLCSVLRIMTKCSFVTVSWSRVSSRIFHIIVARIWIILYQYFQSDLLISSRLVRGQTVQWAAHYFLFAPGVPFALNDEVYFTVMTVSLSVQSPLMLLARAKPQIFVITFRHDHDWKYETTPPEHVSEGPAVCGPILLFLRFPPSFHHLPRFFLRRLCARNLPVCSRRRHWPFLSWLLERRQKAVTFFCWSFEKKK